MRTHTRTPTLTHILSFPISPLLTRTQELLDKASVGDVAAIKHLIAVGANANFIDLEEGWGRVTPLINAATNGRKSAVMTLLVLGAVLELKDDNGWTALHRAAAKGHSQVVVALVDAGADVAARDLTGALCMYVFIWMFACVCASCCRPC